MRQTVNAPSSASEQTAFVREVILPGLEVVNPKLNHALCKFRLEIMPSTIHRWGVFAAENIPSRRRVIEYTGQRISAKEVYRRSFRQHLYIFWLNEKWALDGAFGGSGAELINHSCEPNLSATIRSGRIFFTSTRHIESGEELTLDYHTEDEEFIKRCRCGASKCKGVAG